MTEATTRDEATAAVESLRAVGLNVAADRLAGVLADPSDEPVVRRPVIEAAATLREYADVVRLSEYFEDHISEELRREGTLTYGLRRWFDFRPSLVELLGDVRAQLPALRDGDATQRLRVLVGLWKRHNERNGRRNEFQRSKYDPGVVIFFTRDEADALRDLVGVADAFGVGDALILYALRVRLERLECDERGLLGRLLDEADEWAERWAVPRAAAREVALRVAERRGVRLDPKRRRWLVERGGRR